MLFHPWKWGRPSSGKGTGKGMAEVEEQVTVGVREASRLAAVSTKMMRKWVAEGKVRAELREGKFGPTWQIEASSLPLTRRAMEKGIPRVGQGDMGKGEALGEGDSKGGQGAVAALIAMLTDLQRRHEGAVARLGQLEGEREQRLALEERARSLVEREAQARAEAEGLRRQTEELGRAEEAARAEAKALGRQLRTRTLVAIVALVAAGACVVALMVRFLMR